MRATRRTRLLALAAFAFAPLAVADVQDAPTLVIHYFDEARPLTLDPTRVAVLTHQASDADAKVGAILGPALTDAIVAAGAVASGAEPSPIRGWSLVPTSPQVQTEAGIRALVEALARPNAREAGASFVSPVFVDDLGGPMFVTPHVLVGFEPGVGDEDARAVLAQALGAAIILDRDWAGMDGAYRVGSGLRSGIDVLAAANALAQRPDVRWAEPDMVFTGRGSLTPNDPSYSNCWGLHNTGQFGGTPDMDMDAPEAWDVTTGDPSIITLVIDTGVDDAHADLAPLPGIDTTTDSGSGEPINQWDNHGTPVGGCVAALINNATGTVGIAPTTKVASARAFITINSSGNWNSTASWTVDALAFAETIGARVTNNSNYYGFTSSAIASKYSDTKNAGMVHFASAGNDAANGATYPSSLPTVNAISALDIDGSLASFSNFGSLIAYSAPGVWAYTTDRSGADGWVTGDYTYASGTSFASPYAAGVAALLLSHDPTLAPWEVEEALRFGATDLGPAGKDNTYGWGFVNAAASLALLDGPPLPFDLAFPSDAITGVSPTGQVNWDDAALSDDYRLLVDDDPAFTSPEVDVALTNSFRTFLPGELAYNTTYSWQVIARNGIGDTPSTATRTFTTAPPPAPGAFSLLLPLNAATDVDTGPLFDWQDSPNADSYLLEVDTVPTFPAPDISETISAGARASEFQLPDGTLAHDTRYYWRVTATNGAGSLVSSPSISSFETLVPPCDCPEDLDGDCDVDVLDFGFFSASFGTSVTPGTGPDYNPDGVIDVFDFALFANAFGCVD